MKASWNGRQLADRRSRGAVRARPSHRAIGDAERVERVLVCRERLDAALDAVGRERRRAAELARPSRRACRAAPSIRPAARLDPLAILRYERQQSAARPPHRRRARRARPSRARRPRSSTVIGLLHLGTWDPARAEHPALAVDDLPVGGDAVARSRTPACRRSGDRRPARPSSSAGAPRRSGRGTNGESQRTSISGWNTYARSGCSASGVRWLTRKTDTERVPAGMPWSLVVATGRSRVGSAVRRCSEASVRRARPACRRDVTVISSSRAARCQTRMGSPGASPSDRLEGVLRRRVVTPAHADRQRLRSAATSVESTDGRREVRLLRGDPLLGASRRRAVRISLELVVGVIVAGLLRLVSSGMRKPVRYQFEGVRGAAAAPAPTRGPAKGRRGRARAPRRAGHGPRPG